MTNPFITNVSRFDITQGLGEDAGTNSVLIQIIDKREEFPTPKYNFREVYQFIFDDVEEEDNPESITDLQAEAIAAILVKAYSKGSNVVCHCHAGICRSGAVVEVGLMLGFNEPDRFRLPNALVKKKLMQALGMDINEKSSAFNAFTKDFRGAWE